MTVTHNVHDRHRGWIGSWETAPIDPSKLKAGLQVVYQDFGRNELGVVSSWRMDGDTWTIYARYTSGDTGAGANIDDLMIAVRPLDGPGA